jgi:hypothetical protein
MITIVSGLPRSGTSLMMQMLQAGGLRLQTDTVREPDEHNLRGYYEDRRVRSLAKDNSWLAEADGMALKVVSLLLYNLPSNLEYRVVFMRRDMDEILRSQDKMLADTAPQQVGTDIRPHFEKHLKDLTKWLPQQDHIQWMELEFRSVFDAPLTVAGRVADFLEQELDREAMATVVDPSLYRQRSSEQ